MTPPAAHVTHAVAGRTRIRIPSQRGRAGYFPRLEERLARLDGVEAVEANPRTGSVLVRHNGAASVEAIAAFAERHGLFRVEDPDRGPTVTAAEALRDRFGDVDRVVAAMSGSALDLRTFGLLCLAGMGVLQLSRGNIAPPATTAFWYAASLLLMLSPQGSGPQEGGGVGEGGAAG